MQGYANFLTCTPLISTQPTRTTKPYRIHLTWNYTNTASDYTKIEIYRVIGEKGGCNLDLSTFSFTGTAANLLIYTATTNVPNITSYTDDLSLRYTNGTKLATTNGLASVGGLYPTNKQIIDDIWFSQRPMYYVIRTYGAGGDTSPYVVISHSYIGAVQCISTKTQVRHNVLHKEGKRVWIAYPKNSNGAIAQNISRTAVDTVRIWKDPDNHAGPSGRGGHAWVTSRGSNAAGAPPPENKQDSHIYNFNLKDGYVRGRHWMYNQNNGFVIAQRHSNGCGIAIDYKTGNAIVGTINNYYQIAATPSQYGAGLFLCNVNNINDQNTLKLNIKNWTGGCYGLTSTTGKPNTYYMTQIGFPSNKDPYGIYGYYHQKNVVELNLNKTGVYDGIATVKYDVENAPHSIDPTTQPAAVPYGICSGPDGTIFSSRWVGNNYIDYYTTDGVHGDFPLLTAVMDDFPSTTSDFSTCKGITTDRQHIYPHSTGERYNVFVATTMAGARGSKSGKPINGRVMYATFNPTTNQFVTDPKQITLPYTWPYGTQDAGGWLWPTGVGCDSENNIWISGYGLAKYYQLEDTTEFPYGGNCRYPAVPLSAWAYSDVNTREVEWFLTREPNQMTAEAAAVYNALIVQYTATRLNATLNRSNSIVGAIDLDTISVSGWESGNWSSYSQQDRTLQAIISFANTYNTSSSYLIGRKVFPNYTGKNTTRDFTGYAYADLGPIGTSWAYMYSDFTGNVLVQNLPEVPYNYAITHPETTQPQISLKIVNGSNSAPLQESSALYPWKDTNINTEGTKLTGYDDLTVTYQISVEPGTFIPSGWRILHKDYATDYKGNINTNYITLSTNANHQVSKVFPDIQNTIHTYTDPSLVGLPNNLHKDSRRSTDTFVSQASVVFAFPHLDPYTCDWVVVLSNTVSAIAIERYPQSRFYIDSSELISRPYRTYWFGCSALHWKPSTRFIKTGNYKLPTDKFANGNTYTGVDPVYADVIDRSIARSYPITSWKYELSASNQWNNLGWNAVLGTNTGWAYTSTLWITSSSMRVGLSADTINYYTLTPVGPSKIFRYGVYGITEGVSAYLTNTPAPESFTQYVCVQEFEPFANFWAISAMTVPPTYSDTTSGATVASLISTASQWPMLPNAAHNFVSGYAPNLTVWFKDSSEAHTFPISSYEWNFGDYYDEGTNVVELTTTQHTGDFVDGCWSMTSFESTNTESIVLCGIGHVVKHTYVMPGIYDVTLTVKASNTSTQDICACYTDVDQYYVYVEEIPPRCCFELRNDTTVLSAISGISPTTIYANATCVTAGSFPICRLDWNFGDGTIETVTRIPTPTATNNGTVLTYISAFAEDVNDPRNYIVPHSFVVDTATGYSNFTVNLSVYACNTNTKAPECSGFVVGPIYAPSYTPPTEQRHLINSRYVDNKDILYVFEGDTNNTTYTVVLSSGG